MWMRHSSDDDNKILSANHFYFVRHGQTPWGADDILKGPQDLPLNETGKEQARNAAFTLKNLLTSDAKMVSSTLQRAIETANWITAETGIGNSAQEYGLRERYYGDYRLTNDPKIIPPDAETDEDFQNRVSKTVDALLVDYHQANPLILVSHQKLFEFLAEHLAKRKTRLDQGGIAHFIKNENGDWNLEILKIKKVTELSESKEETTLSVENKTKNTNPFAYFKVTKKEEVSNSVTSIDTLKPF